MGPPLRQSILSFPVDRADEKLHRRTTVRMGIRVVQRAYPPPSPTLFNIEGPSAFGPKDRSKNRKMFGCRMGQEMKSPMQEKPVTGAVLQQQATIEENAPFIDEVSPTKENTRLTVTFSLTKPEEENNKKEMNFETLHQNNKNLEKHVEEKMVNGHDGGHVSDDDKENDTEKKCCTDEQTTLGSDHEVGLIKIVFIKFSV